VFSVQGNKTYLDEEEFRVIGLRCSNALLSDETTRDLIAHLDEYRSYGINTISVYFMGSRYSDIRGFNPDATLNIAYAERMESIIKACDERGMVVLVGVLYWGMNMGDFENPYYDHWDQAHANLAMRHTVEWLHGHSFRNVFVDPDNEGMAHRGKGFNLREMIAAAKAVDPSCMVAFNFRGTPPPNADMAIHHSDRDPDIPYIETEGTMPQYWGEYSKENGGTSYINVGIYTERKKAQQLELTRQHLDRGDGYIFASTWLQNVPPHYETGGDGSPCNPGIRWWLEFIKSNYGSWLYN